MTREHPKASFERYADDAVVHCVNHGQAQRLVEAIADRMRAVGLELHPAKTKIVYCKDANRRGDHEVASFTFLGYTFRARGARNQREHKTFTAPAGQVLTTLARLVDRSVLIREDHTGPGRYRLLETVRQYGLARLRQHPGTEDALRRRHRDHYLRLAEQGEAGWSGPAQEDIYRGLRREHPNLRAALDLCLATPRQARTGLHLAGTLWFYFTGCGFLREGRHWLGRLLAAAPSPARNGPRRCGPPARSRSPRAIPTPPTASSSRAGNRRPRPETNGSSGWPD